MREIVKIQIGRCGNQIGSNFWETISEEHSISKEGRYEGNSDLKLEKLNVYYEECSAYSRYIPRTVFADLEPGSIEAVQASSLGRLFRPENFISGQGSAGNIWAKGFYTDGAEIIENVLDSVRKEIERCDSYQGFQISHAIGGGTGSGLGSLMCEKISEHFCQPITQLFTVFPSTNTSDNILQAYNAALFLPTSRFLHSAVQVLDNEALFNICQRTLHINSPTYRDLNYLIADVMAGITCSFRFPSQLNSDLRKFVTNLQVFPRLLFHLCSYAPLRFLSTHNYQSLAVNELVKQVFDPRNAMCNVDPRSGRYFTGAISFRGIMPSSEVEEALQETRNQHSSRYVDWIPDSFKSSLCDIPPKKIDRAACFIFNSSSVIEKFRKIESQASSMFRRRAFLHWYQSEGMDEMEFTEALSDLNDRITEYTIYQEATTLQNDDEDEIYE